MLAPLYSQEKSIPYAQADRDRLVRVETRIEGLDKRIDDVNNRIDDLNENVNQRFDDVNKRIDDLSNSIIRLEDNFNSYFMWGFGIIFMSIMGLVGFIIYDRRTTLAPVERKAELMLNAMRKLSETNVDLREIMKNTAL